MIRRLLVAAVFALAMIAPAAVTTAAPAPITVQGTNYITETYYYSDATYTQEVGFDQGDCCYFGACYTSHTGQSSNYIQYQHIGYCARDGGMAYWEPL